MARNTSTSTYLPPLLFSITLFTSAGLLFWIQPLIAKTLLPRWGGTPAVWNTCLLFFQTMLQNCASGSVSVVEGDARLNLQNAPEAHYGLIVLDAFSSDAIPVHLLTQQALDLYLSKLAEGGILAFHASSRSLNLNPILADLAESRNLICIGFDDSKPSSLEGKDPSQWVVMARSSDEISYLSINSQWERLTGRKETRVWSDDFSNILRAIRWTNLRTISGK